MDHIIELDAWRLPAGPLETLRWCDGQGFTTLPGDSPPNTFIAPRLAQPLLARRDLFDKATTFGVNSPGAGELRLINVDGALDALLTGYAIHGRQVRAWRGQAGAPWPAAWQRVMTGIAELATASDSELVIRLRDPLALLDKPMLPASYAGNNPLPDGLEGSEEDLKGKRKPRVLGRVANIAPPMVNTARLICQLSDQPASVSAVYDRGLPLEAGEPYPSIFSMLQTVPAAGQYRSYSGPEGCFVRLGSSPAGMLTADASSEEVRAASLAASVVQGMGGSVDAGDIAALNNAMPAMAGVWVQDDVTALAVVSDLLGSIGAYGSFDAMGVLRIARLEPPVVASASLRRDRVLSIALLSTADSDAGIPAWRVTVEYDRNYTASNDLAGAVSATRRAWCGQPARRVVVSDTDRQAIWPAAPELTFSTALCRYGDAMAEAQRRLALYAGRRLYEVRYRAAQGEAYALGQVVQLAHPRFGLSAGMALRVIGIVHNHRLDELVLRLWG